MTTRNSDKVRSTRWTEFMFIFPIEIFSKRVLALVTQTPGRSSYTDDC
jgi:hypothetical protein